MYYVYILRSKDKKLLYKGITANIGRRLKEHNSNKCLGTRGKGPWEVVYFEERYSRKEAREREKFFKSGEGRELLRQLINNPL